MRSTLTLSEIHEISKYPKLKAIYQKVEKDVKDIEKKFNEHKSYKFKDGKRNGSENPKDYNHNNKRRNTNYTIMI